MRPITGKQNPLRWPLNQLLGKEAHVRLLRLLTSPGTNELTPVLAAQATGLTHEGARKALDRLAKTGAVTMSAEGPHPRFQLNHLEPMVSALQVLFDTERERYDRLCRDIKTRVCRIAGANVSAWIKDHPKNLGDPVTVAILLPAAEFQFEEIELRNALATLGKRYDQSIELDTCTSAALKQLNLSKVELLCGPAPSFRNAKHGRHVPLPALAAIHEPLGALLRENATILPKAVGFLQSQLANGSSTSDDHLREWLLILKSYSLRRLLQFLSPQNPRAQQLWRRNPFISILTPAQMAKMLRSESPVEGT